MSVKNSKILLLLAAASLMFSACEDTIPAGTARYSPTTPPPPQRTVLIEEYTGTSCINCPNGHAVIEAIENYYNTPENLLVGAGVLVVGIHIPNWGSPVENGGLITPEASAIAPDGITPPQARINRSSGILNRDKWTSTTAIYAAVAPSLTYPEGVSATESNDNITVKCRVSPSSNISDARLHVWLVEDNIKKRQRLPDGSIDKEYIHNNVFRAAVTPVSGQAVNFVRNTDCSFEFNYPVNTAWKVNNMRAIVFIETASTGVINAAHGPVISQ